MRAFSLLKHGAAILGLAGIGLAFGAGPAQTDRDWFMNQLELTDGYISSAPRSTPSAAGVEGKAGTKIGASSAENDRDWFTRQLELTDGSTSVVHRGAPSAAGVEGKAGKKGADPAPTSGNTESRFAGTLDNPWPSYVSH